MLVPKTWDLPEEIRRRFGLKGAGHQRAMAAEGHLLLILHCLPLTQGRGSSQSSDPLGRRQPVFFWRSPQGRWRSDHRISGIQGLQQHVKSYETASEALAKRLHRAQWADDYFQLLQDIAPVELAAKNLHATLQAAREAVPEDRDLIDVRDWAREIERSLSLLYISTQNALNFYMARQAETQARLGTQSIKIGTRLNVLAALFFPLTAIASLFGMNLPSGLELQVGLFWLVLLIGVAMGVVTQRWVLDGRHEGLRGLWRSPQKAEGNDS
ncbi:CorA family divalent cation transporter [Lyngbya confervoides]|uniref:CorA-like Mg2+ transporter protein n=1 Tax=Lyngbya confervoides BDU141951 TaxID=1574623 RepID=A0ABD4T3I3_9CYAN|nr:CorA family divalent cation transporter [Lyngbya confervoides]MCM1983033.1 hypothetical protein [Lyngbya confervoides BDU141951]